ncbi:DNA-deoxyinosine glycosylase [Salipaludibacillus sp. HK11]|uniref:DNA-deoxyinosine glycosylase n=1 Tax=Salipaludibacillus sp. HK11 TaxID=3394320 RepID=UPI0039FBD43C
MTNIASMEPIIAPGAKVLILGSMPGKQSLETQQYYGNPRNHFWAILSELLDSDLTEVSYEEKCAFLKEKKIALWDVIATCEREGSLDSAIRREKMNDLTNLIKLFPTIQGIGLNGTKAFQSFQTYLKKQPIPNIAYTKLPSTSPVPGKNVKSFAEKVESWHVIKEYLTMTGEKQP